jgi:hypothetical protein
MFADRNLLLGLFTGNSFRQLEPFVASLHQIGFDGDACILVADVSGETIAALRAHGIAVERLGRSGQPRMTAMASRYFSYLDFLVRRGTGYSRVMLLDPSRIVLQSDPFAVPQRAALVYTSEQSTLGGSSEDRDAMVQAYGEAVADNVRDCTVSCPDVTIGTSHGMLQYLVAMTHELSSRTVPIGGYIDRAIHNYVVHMRPLRDAWLDTSDTVAVALRSVPGNRIAVDEGGVWVDDKLPPILNQWEERPAIRDYVSAAPRFRLDAQPPAPVYANATPPSHRDNQPASNAVLAYYHRPRDEAWLGLFLTSLRSTGHAGPIHCVGDFNQTELTLLEQYAGTPHPIEATDPGLVENLAHLAFSQLVERLAADNSVSLDQLLLLDSVHFVFLRDPFENKTIGLSAFWEDPTRINESPYNEQRLTLFPPIEEAWLQYPIVSSSLLRGTRPAVQTFYRKLLPELVGRAEHLRIQKVIQGAVNKLCYSGMLGIPITFHPNGAEAFLEIWPHKLALDTRLGIRIGGAVPAMVMNPSGISPLVEAVIRSLGLELPGTSDV